MEWAGFGAVLAGTLALGAWAATAAWRLLRGRRRPE
jgi:hypothetical protein